METLHTLFYFSIVIGILVSIHEFGHFWVARKAGVKVLRFSIGFGKVLWSYQKHPEATEYVLSAIPLGGYVKMVDERESPVKPEDLPHAFNRQSLFARSAIVIAGPLFNLFLAVFLFWCALVLGETGIKPILGAVTQGTIAASAGLAEGDEILAINDKPTPTWSEAINVVINAALEGTPRIAIQVKTNDDTPQIKTLDMQGVDTGNAEALYKQLGFNPWSPKLKPVIGKVLPDSAALAAGLQAGDLIISANSEHIDDWMQWVEIVKLNPSKPIQLTIERNDVQSPLTVTPKSVVTEQGTEGKIGASVYIPEDLMKAITIEYSLSPLAAIPAAFETTYFYSWTTLKMMGKMLIGKASVENLSGPISIAQYAGQSASMGLVHFIKFMGLVSVSLGVLNLLPIPVLDGGHLLFFGLEALKGSPVSEKIQLSFQQIGISLLVTLMALAMFLDVQRLFE